MAEAGNLSALITSGFDAFNNLWDVDITLPAALGGTAELGYDISLRTADFTPPKFSMKTYKVYYKGIELERLSATLEYKDNRELTLKFRIDGEYGLLEKLQQWKQLYYNPSNDGNIRFGMYSSADKINGKEDPYGTITVKAYKSVNANKGLTLNSMVNETNISSDLIETWKFNDVCLLDVNVNQYIREGDSKAQEVECLFIYGRVTEPFAAVDSSLSAE